MISKKLTKSLTAQIGHEFAASQQYLAIAAYFGLQNLEGWARFFHKQSEEERGHALRIVRFLVDVDAAFSLPAIPEAKTEYESALAAVQWALDNEREVTKQFQEMARQAIEENDQTSLQFLQWFIEEQVEEEASMSRLVALVDSGINLFRAEQLLKHPEEDHQ